MWKSSQHRGKPDEVEEDLVEGLSQVLLIRAIQNVPILPEDFTEDLLSNILVLNVVLWIYSDYFSQWLHEMLKRRLLAHILSILVMERFQGSQNVLTIL